MMINFFNYLLVFSVFAGGFSFTYPLFEFCIGYLFVIAFLAAYAWRYRSINVNPIFFIILMVLTVSSAINVYLGNNTVLFMAKQVIGISAMGTAYYLLFKVNNFEIDKLFKTYMRIALIVAAIGIFQEFSYLLGFEYGYNFKFLIPKWGFKTASCGIMRVNSIFMEPSHYAITMAPAFFVALTNLLRGKPIYMNSKWGSATIVVSYILTFSAVAYIGVLIGIGLILLSLKKIKHIIAGLILMLLLMYVSYSCVLEIRERVDATIAVVTGETKVNNVHHSIYTVASHAFVAYKSFIDNPVFGHGLGSHPISYERFIRLGAPYGFWAEGIFVTNQMDAASLFVRLVSETGLVGAIAVLFFIFRFRVNRSDNKKLYMISNAVFILFILQLIKQGHYFYNGLFFFVWLHYFTKKTEKIKPVENEGNREIKSAYTVYQSGT